MLVGRPDETVGDVTPDRSSEQRRLLRDEADLGAEPLDVEVLEVNAVQLDATFQGVVETLNETDDGRLAGTASTDKRNSMADGESEAEILENGNSWTRWVVERDIGERDFASTSLGLQTFFGQRVDRRDTVNGLVKLCRRATRLDDSYNSWSVMFVTARATIELP